MTEQADASVATTTYNLLFVCTGNTCRSPMAAVLAQHDLARRGWAHVRVASAGVAAAEGAPASDGALAAVRMVGLDLEDHRARLLDEDQVGWADLILTMSPSHLDVVEDLGGGHKAALLGAFAAGREGEGAPVPDPFGGDIATYRSTLGALTDLVHDALDRLAPIVRP